MRAAVACFLLVVSTSWVAAAQEPPQPTAKELITEGVRLHDAGRFDDAIQRFKQALALEPENSVAWYELANTYLYAKRYDLCEEAARKGLKKPGPLEAGLSTMVGSCLSSAGKAQEALRIFEDALNKYPNDPLLNFNISVTLVHEGKLQKAVEHLQRAVAADPSYMSSYYALGSIADQQDDAISGIFYFMRFMFTQPSKDRGAVAASKVFELLTQGVSADGDKNVTLTLGADFGEKEGTLAGLELSRTIAAATIHLEEAKKQSKAERYVSALVNFVKIADEMTQAAESAGLRQSFVWERAAAPIIQLDRRGVLESFGYILAKWANYEGAEEWLKKNPQKMQELEAALADLRG